MKWRDALFAALLTLLLVATNPVYPHFPSPNEFSRWLTAVSLVEDHSFEVSKHLGFVGPRFEDLAVVGSRVYSNKAPAPAVMAAVHYALLRPLMGEPDARNVRLSLYAMRLLCATLPFLLLLWQLGRTLRGMNVPDTARRNVLLIGAIGTPLLPLALLFFSHALVAALLFCAWSILFTAGREHETRNGVIAGLALGLAVASDYPTALPAFLITVVVAAQRRWSALLALLVAAAPFAVALGLYNLHCFGGVFTPSYRFEKVAQYRDAAAMSLPSFSRLLRLLFDPNKGLFVFAPALILSLFGFRRARRELDRGGHLLLMAIPLAILLTYAAFPNWHGGWTVGPRYITTAIPFLLVPLAFVRWNLASDVLIGASVAAVVCATFAFPFIPGDYPLPWSSFALPILRDGLVAPNVFHFVGRGAAVAFPFVTVLALIVTSAGARRAVAVVLGSGLMITAGWMVVGETPRRMLQRAYIEDVYFGQNGTLDRIEGVGERLRARREYERALPPSEWPF